MGDAIFWLVCAVVVGIVAILVYSIASAPESIRLNNAIILITGAAKGLGRELALQSIARGARLMLWDVDAEGLEETALLAREIAKRSGMGGMVLEAVCVDLSSAAARSQAIDEGLDLLATETGPVVLINNAGVVRSGPVAELDSDDFALQQEVNFLAPVDLIHGFLPAMCDSDPWMERAGSRIVNVSSILAMTPGTRVSVYASTKAALMAFTQSLRLELQVEGARVSTLTVNPFAIDTGMFAGALEGEHDPWVRKMFFPMLQKEDVARTMLRGIEQGTQWIILPWYAFWSQVIFLSCPVPFYDLMVGYLAGWHGMDHFVGRDEEELPSKRGKVE